jgi:lipopolysaccharide transport system ATP-binding protein
MSSDAAVIRAEGLSKRYRLGSSIRHDTLRDSIAHGLRSLTGRPASRRGSEDDVIWALRDFSFRTEEGEVLGIIGRNGAGKSTLLKIISRITEPTEGEIRIRGRVVSLLEVGTGFHSELTGRENIFLSGVILGMKKAEIRRKFDEIVSFAGVERFLDTPVKRFSSGMYVRLAFAVAAHLEPEILVVDEVLAVGDAAFQKKCLGKMDAVAKGGRTILFVSHNMNSVKDLCSRCIWIDGGKFRRGGEPREVIKEYLESAVRDTSTSSFRSEEEESKEFQLLEGRLIDSEDREARNFDCDGPVIIDLLCRVRKKIPGLYGYLSIGKLDGTKAMVSDSYDVFPNPLDDLQVGLHSLRIEIPPRTLGPGDYSVYLNFTSSYGIRGYHIDSPGSVLQFRLDDWTSRRGNSRRGYFSTLLQWKMKPVRGRE